MALALSGFELRVTFYAFDDDGVQVERTKLYEIASSGADDAAKRTNAQTTATSLTSLLGDLSGAGIGMYRLTEIWEDDALAVPTDNLYKEAIINVALNATGTKKGFLAIPGPSSGGTATDLLNSDGKSINVGGTSVQAFMDLFKASDFARLSDGETVRDTNPILDGRVRAVKSGQSY